MNRAARWLGWLAFAFALLVTTSSAADDGPSTAYVARYEIDITPHGDEAAFRVLIEYGDAAAKTDGFKFFGTSSLGKLRVTDEHDKELHYSRIVQDHETKITFDLAPGASPRKTAILTFEQDLEIVDDWFGRAAEVSWGSKFRIPVHAMTVRLHGVSDAGRSFRCAGSGSARVCTRSSNGPFFVSFPQGSTPIWVFLALAAVVGVSLIFVAAVVVRKRDALVAAHGVVPPVVETAYLNPGDYRAAPVLPKGGDVEPTLGAGDVRAFRLRLLGAGIAGGLPAAALIAASGVSSAPHLCTAAGLVIGCMIFGYLVIREKPRGTLFALPIAVAVFGVFGALVGSDVGAVIAGLFAFGTFGFAHIIAVAGAAFGGASGWRGASIGSSSWSSGSSWSSSSSSSSSSCGGGGGSSCGGGGGSSCGGGGGGGGGCGG